MAWHFTGPPGSCEDDLGFEWQSGDSREEYAKWWAVNWPVIVRRRKRWDDKDPRLHPDILQRFVHKGVPAVLRREIWLRSLPSLPTDVSPVPPDVVDAIRLDLPRTFPDNTRLRSQKARNRLGRMLYALAQRLPEVGYCQGLNFIAATLLLVVNDEKKATDLFVHEVSLRRSHFDTTMSGLRRDMKVLHQLISSRIPSLSPCLSMCVECGGGLGILVGRWFLCWYVESLPMETTLRIWDCLFYDGDVWLFRVAVRLFRSARVEMSRCRALDQLITCIREVEKSKHAINCHALIKGAESENISISDIEKLRKRFEEE